MKLAGFGLIVGLVGLVLGVDGLLFAGGIWIVTGLLVRLLVQPSVGGSAIDAGIEVEVGRIESAGDRTPRLGVAGMLLLLASGLGSIAIGVLGVGFPSDYEYPRWFPVVIGALITLIGLISIPVELGRFKTESDPAE